MYTRILTDIHPACHQFLAAPFKKEAERQSQGSYTAALDCLLKKTSLLFLLLVKLKVSLIYYVAVAQA